MTAPERSRLARERLSRELRRLRVAAGLTGTAAARAAGMSQSKISKIENGMLLPSVADVERLTAEFGATDEVRDELTGVARALHSRAEGRRVVLQRNAHRRQWEIAQLEARAAVHRQVLVSAVPVLLQTERYMRAVLASLPADDREAAARDRLVQQRVLDDPAKRFLFVLAEGALRWRIGGVALMAEQMDHLATLAGRGNVRLGVIPWTAETGVVASHGFHVYDDRLVTLSVLTANAVITDPVDVGEYLALFERLDGVAVHGEDLRRLLFRVAEEYRALRAGEPGRPC
jgi:transcriptional regulator with XRE-family HTH domain